MRLFLFISLASLLTGCLSVSQPPLAGSVIPGSQEVQVGKVNTFSALKYSGKVIPGQLIVKTDENSNTILNATDAKLEVLSIYLTDGARADLVQQLRKIQEWGSLAKQDSIEGQKLLGSVSSSDDIYFSYAVNLTFASTRSGQTWVCLMDLTQSLANRSLSGQQSGQANKYPRKLNLVLPPAEITELLGLLEQIQEVKSQSAISKDTSRLFQQVPRSERATGI